MTANERVVKNPELPIRAEPTNITYKGKSRYITISITTVPKTPPISGAMRAGFVRPVLSVQGPQNGATISDGMVMKKVFPKSIFVARLCTCVMTKDKHRHV